MAYEKIRKNAKKKITSLLGQSVGIIGNFPQSRIDDSFDCNYRIVKAEEVLAWLADADNYADARVYFDADDNCLVVKGPYYFCDSFTAYLSEEVYQVALDWAKPEGYSAPVVDDPAPALPKNVVSLCAYRQKLAS
ncbi:hypothetical protein [Pontibacterium sp.]|uniref:hypothetical protein n=1 Tax=Pontibacterium sp. TaxID=2036026 RepID=UPI003564CF98